MIDVLAPAALGLAWFVFRYDRHSKRREAIEAAEGTLRAVHHGMVQGLTPGQAVGWGQFYFQQDFTEETAARRASETWQAVMDRELDQVFVVPVEPLAKLATTTPQPDLIRRSTVAVANHALWRLHRFNQLVQQLTDFNTQHAAEIQSEATDQARRFDLANAAASLSHMLHLYGIGVAWAQIPDAGRGWYGALLEEMGGNMTQLATESDAHRWRWLHEWPYTVVDLFVVAGLIAVVVSAAC